MKQFTFLLPIAITIASCTHVYYAPNTANAPLLTEKGETRINALYSSGGVSEFTGGELQFARAISKNFAVMGNGMVGSRSDEVTNFDIINWGSETHTETGKGSYLEFAGGYFSTLDAAKKVVFETYTGIGFGTVNNDYGFGDVSKVNSTKVFLQPSIGYKSTHFEVAFVPKVSYINWSLKQDRFSSPNNSYAEEELAAIKTKPSFVAFEPALILRAGGKGFKVQASISVCGSPSNPAFSNYSLIETTNASIGISIDLKPGKK